MLAGSINAQEKLAEYSDTVDTPNPESVPPISDEKILHLYKDIAGDRYALQVEVNKKTGNYDLFKHYLTEEDDLFIDKLDVTIKYLPDLDLEYPGDIRPKNKQESESMRATNFSCSTIPINDGQSTYVSGNNVHIAYDHLGNGPGNIGTIYGNAAICKEDTVPNQNPPPKHHRLEFNVITWDYNGQASHAPTIARYKWGPGNYGIGMYFGHANKNGNVPYPCLGGIYGGATLYPQYSY